jgi:2-polyprenyl-6-methoxyphenol hydroxylase-like FAD-dependent oxidoreductase
MKAANDYDVVIVGASLAGCTAARLYGQQGLRVALIDRRTNIADYKRICTHFIQPSATPVIERLGLATLIEQAGGVRNRLDTWTRWGWIRVPDPYDDDGSPPPYGYSIRRERLDPMLRELASETDGVELMLGKTAERLVKKNGHFTGVVRSTRGGEEQLSSRLLIGADGRASSVGEMSGVRARVRPNNRFCYFAYYRDLELKTTSATAQAWALEVNTVIAHRNDEDVTLITCFVDRRELPAFKRDPEGNFVRLIESLPMGPDIGNAERFSPMLGKLEMPNSSRRTAVSGLAFIGDAAMTADPLWAVGCGMAFQSAEWLADCTMKALVQEGESLDRGLARYRKRHRSNLFGFYFQSSNYSTRRKFLPHEKLILSSAAKDVATARRFTAFGEGLIRLREFLSPRSLGRAAWVALTRRRSPNDEGASKAKPSVADA